MSFPQPLRAEVSRALFGYRPGGCKRNAGKRLAG